MTVKAIVCRKGTDVITIDPTVSLANAAKTLSKRGIGALIITGADRQVDGILSERDIVRALAERGSSALEEPVGEVMARKVLTCSETDTVGEIMERMTVGKFRHLPVVERGRLAGLISIGDVVKYRLEEMAHESKALHEYILTA